MNITEEEIITFCEAMKERMIRELTNGIKVEVYHNAHYDPTDEASLIGETLYIRFGDGPDIAGS
ncbi:MAG TPA: hypothetical protein VGB63_18250 [Pedobacter sp.]|jgi:hypothetical protein